MNRRFFIQLLASAPLVKVGAEMIPGAEAAERIASSVNPGTPAGKTMLRIDGNDYPLQAMESFDSDVIGITSYDDPAPTVYFYAHIYGRVDHKLGRGSHCMCIVFPGGALMQFDASIEGVENFQNTTRIEMSRKAGNVQYVEA